MIKVLIIRLLIRLLGHRASYWDIKDKQVINWLADQGADVRYREMFRRRDLQLLKTLGSGLGREEYLLAVGQWLELLQQLQKVDEAYKIKEKERTRQQKEAEQQRKKQVKKIQS